ncbi:MAG: UDP-N-acetylglucosamine 2-epimerase (non-hydrolyzing) [Rhodospirillaceae bacterium]|nr:UDP-N-acetylglucosamine 2-epimerase (non-hydrolyzing) [Rhodospirillaceae bacterium]
MTQHIPKVHLIAGARPNFMKIAPLMRRLSEEDWCRPVLIHTGQHYDAAMSDIFFTQLGIPAPDHNLAVGSGPHGAQTGAIMQAYEALCRDHRPDWIIVVGDVNSTLACSLVAAKDGIPVAHLEAGLRSFDRTMPEEINRIVTDTLADLLWTPSPDADDNLKREGIDAARIERVGNIMIDSLVSMRHRFDTERHWHVLGLDPGAYGVVTLHRPSNVDDAATLAAIVEALTAAARDLPLVLPLHPRTSAMLETFGLSDRLRKAPGIHAVPPLGYIPFMSLVTRARLVITDSGGLQEETTYLRIPCLTLRDNTERPVTIHEGTNRLIRPADLGTAIGAALAAPIDSDRPAPALWDGNTAARVAASLKNRMSA